MIYLYTVLKKGNFKIEYFQKGADEQMEEYKVTGMSCAACSSHVEKAVAKVQGVDNVAVSLLTNSMTVEGSAKEQDIIAAVEKAGYGAVRNQADAKSQSGNSSTDMAELENKETGHLRKRLIASVVVLLPLMYLSMGYMMWNWPVPEILKNNYLAIGLIQLLLTILIMIINQKFFISGFLSAVHRAPNMDTLVALGAGASFLYSTYALFAMTHAVTKGNAEQAMHYMHEFYFESAAMILTLITLGKMLEAFSKGKTTDALKSLIKLSPKSAVILKNGKEVKVPIEEVQPGDIFVVRPGEHIPVDGTVIEGTSAVNEAALTGESIPADKTKGDTVSAATVNQSGFLKCKAVRVGENTALSQIIRMVREASSTKAPIAKAADKVSGVFVPVVILIAALTIFLWLLAGKEIGFALARGISVLVISCPCALGLATPVAIMVGNGMGAKNGILFKNAVSLEETGKAQIAALDKTGTITKGEPVVTDILPAETVSEYELLHMAFLLEKKSEHPLAKAIVNYAETQQGISQKERQQRVSEEVQGFSASAGNGLSAELNGEKLIGGKREYVEKEADISERIVLTAEELANQGKTPLFFAKNGKFYGIIAVADVVKEDSREAVLRLKEMGIGVVMLTGDNEKTAKAVGSQSGVDEVVANVLPDGKEEAIKKLKEQGKTIMVGDGINDAPALTRADIGIAIGAGTDVAIDAADVVLMKNSLYDAYKAIRLSKAVLRNIHENLFWAFIYNVIGIPLAAGVWIPVFGWKLNPMFGAAAMSLSSFCVVMNALRLNLFKVNAANIEADSFRESVTPEYALKEQAYNTEKEIKMAELTKVIEIKGMMCGHCEAHVKKALEELSEVVRAEVSHEKGTAVVTLNTQIEDEKLRKAVEEQEYEVVRIQ